MTHLASMAGPEVFHRNHPPIDHRLMYRQEARLASFCTLTQFDGSHPIYLASAGLFYTGSSDTVQCFSCMRTFSDWSSRGTDPVELHRQSATDCQHLQGVDSRNVPIPVPDIHTREVIREMLRHKYAQMEITPSSLSPRFRRLETGSDDLSPLTEFRIPPVDPDLAPAPAPGHQEIPGLSPNHYAWHDPAELPEAPLEAAEPNTSPEIDFELCKTSVTERLKTFEHWPVPSQIHPTELAQAGFVYTGPQDRVQCVFCEGSLRNWQAGDVPSVEHQRHFPACIMARGGQPSTPNLGFLRGDRRRSSPLLVPSGSGAHTIVDSPSPTDTALPPSRESTPTGIVTERPKHAGMAIEAARIGSYRNWPPGKTQTPQQLAKAGFFYAGFNDSVKCFFCDGGLRNWERDDDPWHEHARWFPRCKYVRQVKGDHFVERVLAEEGGKVPQSASYQGDPDSRSQTGHGGHVRSGSMGRESAESRRVVEPREVTARMDSPVVQAVLNMDIPPELVRRAIEQRLRSTGDDFPSMEALLEVVFSLSSSYSGGDRHSGGVDHASGAGDEQSNPSEMRVGPVEAPRSLIEENRQLKEQRTCKICMDEEVCVVFVPCGHLVCCATCAPPLSKCPICRSTIRGTVRTYMS